MTTSKVEFWFEFASTCSHVAAQRIEAAARTAGVPVVWRPFLLGTIFRRQGWNDSPRSSAASSAHPTFLIGSELYWGNDRLDDALACCAGLRSS